MTRLLHARDLVALFLIVALTGLVTSWWVDKLVWTPDGVFYHARVLEIRGDSEEEALAKVWDGPYALGAMARTPEQAADPRWVPYYSRFYRRRVVVPLAAAAVYPLLGTDSLPFIAILGCFAIGPLLFALLRQRFDVAPSLIAVLLCLLWPPLRWAFLPLTESWGLALEIAALLGAVLVLDRGKEWLPLWVAAIFFASFTREVAPVLLVAAAGVAILHRSRDSWRLLWTGALAALPALLLVSEPLRDRLAVAFNAFVIPADASWAFILDRYPGAVQDLINQNFDYLGEANPAFLEGHSGLMVPLAIMFCLALVVLFATVRSRPDAFYTLARGAFLGGLIYLLALPVFTFLRLELALLPPIAVGLALGAERLAGLVGLQPSRPGSPAPRPTET